MVPTPAKYINLGLYFDGHLDNELMIPHIGNVLLVLPKTTEELANIFKNLGKESNSKTMGDFKAVVVNRSQKLTHRWKKRK